MKKPIAYTITSDAWTAITGAGESGYCWLDTEQGGAKGKADVRIVHSDTGVPADEDVTSAYPVFSPIRNRDQLPFTADSTSDIYYARCFTEGSTAIIQVDARL